MNIQKYNLIKRKDSFDKEGMINQIADKTKTS